MLQTTLDNPSGWVILILMKTTTKVEYGKRGRGTVTIVTFADGYSVVLIGRNTKRDAIRSAEHQRALWPEGY